VTDAGGNYDNVPRRYFYLRSRLAAKLDHGAAGIHGEHFMARTVIVVVREYAVSPQAAPVILTKRGLDVSGKVLGPRMVAFRWPDLTVHE
jgi:hypothetical protein